MKSRIESLLGRRWAHIFNLSLAIGGLVGFALVYQNCTQVDFGKGASASNGTKLAGNGDIYSGKVSVHRVAGRICSDGSDVVSRLLAVSETQFDLDREECANLQPAVRLGLDQVKASADQTSLVYNGRTYVEATPIAPVAPVAKGESCTSVIGSKSAASASSLVDLVCSTAVETSTVNATQVRLVFTGIITRAISSFPSETYATSLTEVMVTLDPGDQGSIDDCVAELKARTHFNDGAVVRLQIQNGALDFCELSEGPWTGGSSSSRTLWMSKRLKP